MVHNLQQLQKFQNKSHACLLFWSYNPRIFLRTSVCCQRKKTKILYYIYFSLSEVLNYQLF